MDFIVRHEFIYLGLLSRLYSLDKFEIFLPYRQVYLDCKVVSKLRKRPLMLFEFDMIV